MVNDNNRFHGAPEKLGNKILANREIVKPPEPKPFEPELTVVPAEVGEAIEYLKTQNNFATLSDLMDIGILTEKGFWWLNDYQFKDRRFGFGGLNNKLFILSYLAITGYKVERP